METPMGQSGMGLDMATQTSSPQETQLNRLAYN